MYSVKQREDETSDATRLFCCLSFDFILGRSLQRVTTFSLISIVLIISISIWEVFYLKRFFVQQKVA
jgi:hypothetical protein